MDLFVVLLAAGAGLLSGWWFLPQPQWAKDLYAKLFPAKS